MIRIGLTLICLACAVGCSGTRKVVVQNGYPGVPGPPPGFEARPAPGPAPAAETPVRFP